MDCPEGTRERLGAFSKHRSRGATRPGKHRPWPLSVVSERGKGLLCRDCPVDDRVAARLIPENRSSPAGRCGVFLLGDRRVNDGKDP